MIGAFTLATQFAIKHECEVIKINGVRIKHPQYDIVDPGSAKLAADVSVS